MKKLILLFFLIYSLAANTQKSSLLGDVNKDGVVNVVDIVKILNIIMNPGNHEEGRDNNISVRKIYGDGTTYCAFTSIVKRREYFYVCFREAKTHVADGDFGRIKILKSSNCEDWELFQTVFLDQFDLRDPCISVMPDDKLILLCGARSKREDGVYNTKTYCSIEGEDGKF